MPSTKKWSRNFVLRVFGRALVFTAALIWGNLSAWADVAYVSEIIGIEDGDLVDLVEDVSRLEDLEDKPPASLIGLERRIAEDIDRIRAALRSQGYYASTIESSVETGPEPVEGEPVRVVVAVAPGPLFTLSQYRIEPEIADLPPDSLGLALGQAAKAQDVEEAERLLLARLAQQARPLAKVVNREVVVDHEVTEMRVLIRVDPGPYAVFGPLELAGLDRVEREAVLKRAQWPLGRPFDSRKLEAVRQRLIDTGLFSAVRVEPAESVSAENALPVTLVVDERDHRSVGIGAFWSTAEGLGGKAFWEHRNLFGSGERLRPSLFYGTQRRAAELAYRDPDFRGIDQDLIYDVLVEEQDTEAFDSFTAQTSLGMAFKISPALSVTASGAVERTRQEQDNQAVYYTLSSLPLDLTYDTTTDLLDPTSGARTFFQVRPYTKWLGSDLSFTSADVQQTAYLPVIEDDLVLAGWARMGATFEIERDELPPSKRFYVGGGGSVRGYGFQLAGPVDDDGDPIGGLSAFAFGSELRWKVTDSIGIVPFVEAGTVYPSVVPDFGEKLFWSGGLGFRYYTDFGPIRADVAVPFNRRNDVDDAFQVYLSIGQAF